MAYEVMPPSVLPMVATMMDSQNKFGSFASTANSMISELPGRMVAERNADIAANAVIAEDKLVKL